MKTPPAILVVNPGSTSTKLAVAQGGEIVQRETILHSADDLKRFSTVWDQFCFRFVACCGWASANITDCSAVVSMGGLLRPLEGGIYRVNDRMLADARANLQGEHASNLGCALAGDLALQYHAPAFVVDPVSVDEFEPLAQYSGHPKFSRKSLSHALNIHAAARRAAADIGKAIDRTSFVICHLGGGISIAPVKAGRIVDVNDAASDGPFSPERTGGLPLQPFISLFFNGGITEQEARTMVMGRGGLVAYLGTNSVKEVERRIETGDTKAKEVYQAMAYQIAKEIGAMSTVLRGKVNAVILTGGVAHSEMLTGWIKERVQFIAPVVIYPGEDEMRSLAESAARALQGCEPVKEY